MRISLVIPAHNEEQYIGGCIDSVLANAPGRFAEIIVVDNASTDATAEVAQKRLGVRVVQEEQKGLTYARQRGLKVSTGDIVAYIDADTRMPKGWAEQVEDVFATRPEVVGFSGPAHYWDATGWQRLLLGLSWWISAPLMYRLVGYMIYGAHFAARRSALIHAGGFDTSISFYGEDTDIARRLSKEGKVLFRMNFFIYSSARRFKKEGFLKTNIIYSLNFLWPALFGKPFTKRYRDIRDTTK